MTLYQTKTGIITSEKVKGARELTTTSGDVILKMMFHKGYVRATPDAIKMAATALGCTREHLRRYLSGNEGLKLKTFLKACEALKINPHDLLPVKSIIKMVGTKI